MNSTIFKKKKLKIRLPVKFFTCKFHGSLSDVEAVAIMIFIKNKIFYFLVYLEREFNFVQISDSVLKILND